MSYAKDANPIRDAAGNDAGNLSDQAVTNQDDEGDPSRPTGLTVEAGDGRLTASWTAPAGVDVARYEVQAKLKTAQDWPASDTDVAATGTSHVFTGLTARAAYQVRVRTVKPDGTAGLWAAAIEGTPYATATIAANLVIEGETAAVTVTLSAPLAINTTIPVTVSTAPPNTAEAGDVGTLSSIAVAAGAASGTGSIATHHDDDGDEDETFTVALDTLPAGVRAGSPSSVTVTIRDDEGQAAPKVWLLSVGPNPVPEGGRVGVSLILLRAPLPQDVTVPLTLTNGTAEAGDRGTLASVTIPAGRCCATGHIPTFEDGDVDDETFTVAIDEDSLPGSVWLDTETPSSVEVTITDNGLAWPEVTIAAGPDVTEGAGAAFTLTADPAPAAALAVSVEVGQSGSFVAASALGERMVTVPAGQASATFTVATVDDAFDEPDGAVTAEIVAGTRYTLPASGTTATVAVADNDETLPLFLVHDGWGTEGQDTAVTFHVALTPRPKTAVTVDWATSDGAGDRGRWGPATAGSDYTAASGTLTFAAGENRKSFTVPIVDDAVDEGIEYFLVTFSNPQGGTLGSAQVLGVIVNSDPVPQAWLARFGRTVAEQAVDAVRGRLDANRAPGFRGRLAGEQLPEWTGSADAARAETADVADDGTEDDPMAIPEFTESERLAFLALLATPAAEDDEDREDEEDGSNDAPESRAMAAEDVMLGTAFEITRATDGGLSFGLWGRVARSGFSGRDGDLELDGEATSVMLGTDWRRRDALFGLMLFRNRGEGGYADPAGSGRIEADLAGLVPWAGRRKEGAPTLWGAAGTGTGEMSLTPEGQDPVAAGLRWSMAAGGAEGAPATVAALGDANVRWRADALATRTASGAVDGLAASSAETTRLRLGLEAAWSRTLASGATLSPRVEVGLRHDGGDAETGFGLEAGGGVRFEDPGRGLSVSVDGRALALHQDGDLRDWGLAVSLSWDPRPETKLGPSALATRGWGGAPSGGVAALLDPETIPGLDEGTNGGAGDLGLEMAWGTDLSAWRHGMTGSAYGRVSGSSGAEALRLGWRVTPDTGHDIGLDHDFWFDPGLGGGPGIGAGLKWSGERRRVRSSTEFDLTASEDGGVEAGFRLTREW